MRACGRLAGVVLVCCVAGLVGLPEGVLADGSSSLSATGTFPSSGGSLGSLVIPGMDGLVGAQQLQAQEEARRANPEAVAARQASRTAFEGLSAARAAQVASEAFPAVIDERAGGPPKLPAGQTIAGFTGDRSALVDLPRGRHGVIESTVPIATETSSGRQVAVDLSLTEEAGKAFKPVTPAVGVRIPKQLSEGVSLADTGVSLTPVAASGAPLKGAEGTIDGASVLFANTEADTDTIVKPVTLGFDADSVLRSVASPQRLSYRVGLPAGGSLVQTKSGSVQVLDNGTMVASVLQPSAQDVAGTNVPVSMGVSGDTLTLTVSDRSGEYRYPIEVDPTVVDFESAGGNTGWGFYNALGGAFKQFTPGFNEFGDEVAINEKITAGEWADFFYETEGKSQIYSAYGRLSEPSFSSRLSAEFYIGSETNKEEARYLVQPELGTVEKTLCTVEPGCGVPVVEAGRDKNWVDYKQSVLTSTSESHQSYTYELGGSTVSITQEAPPSVSLDSTDEIVGTGSETGVNPLYGGGRWVSAAKARLGFEAEDPGLGVQWAQWYSFTDPAWEPPYAHPAGREGGIYESVGRCKNAIQCTEKVGSKWGEYGGTTIALTGLPDGEDKVEAKVWDPVGLAAATASATVKVDSTPPSGITFSGLGSGNEIGEGEYNLKVEAADQLSGMESIAIAVDGREVGKSTRPCLPGPCSTSGEFAINGDEFGAGEHRLKATATDRAGNEAGSEIILKVHHATPMPLGPGSVNPQSGEFRLNATDVSVGAPGSNLAVMRSYGSRHLTVGSTGPLGPQWSLSVGGQESITKLWNGNATLTVANGGQSTFVSSGGGKFNSPRGDANLTLTEVKNEKNELTEYTLKNKVNGGTTHFTSSSGSGSTLWKPTKQEGPLASQTVRYVFQTVEGVTEPKWAIAPEPAGVSSCITKIEKSEALVKGCRALEFKYGTSTKATGENEKEWGEYKGRLKQILLVAYNPSSKKMEEPGIPVAEYLYDKQGRLRAEWNPQVSPALKTVYGYDSEGHVTALTQPGDESWAFTYGGITGDANTGRLLKVMQAPASTAVWNGESVKNTEAPKLTGSPVVVGANMSVSNGKWNGSPITYAYQWERCNLSGGECAPIIGAVNANYTATTSDVGHTLIAKVSAFNGGGSVQAASAASSEVKTGITEYSLGGMEAIEPREITTGPDGNLWFTESSTHNIGKITPTGTITTYALPSETHPEGITAGPAKENALWFTEGHGTNGVKIGKITTSGTITTYPLPAGSEPRQIAVGPDGNLWFTNATISPPKIGKITPAGVITEYSLPASSGPQGIVAGPDGNLWYTLSSTNKIGKITTTGTIKEYSLPGGSRPEEITTGPDGNLWFADRGTHKIGKITTAGVITEYALPSSDLPHGIAAAPEKESYLWFTGGEGNTIGKITTSGVVTEYPWLGTPWGMTAGPDNKMWFTARLGDKIGTLNPNFKPFEGEKLAPNPGWTMEYHVPLSGSGLPTLTQAEVEKWGQADDPVEGTAIFPPDDPQSWPASNYERAAIAYLDEKGRYVNTLLPTGGLSTSEYNSYGDLTRTLSPDNRVAALKESCESKEKCKSAELSKLLDNQSTYEETGLEPGSRLLETLSPQHKVKLAKGKEKANEEVLARDHVKYIYNEGAKAVEEKNHETYNLVTKSTNSAETANKEEFDTRETTTSYSGQENLGWVLRKPTSVVTDPNGLKLTRTTLYEAGTGEVIETRTPANSKEKSPHATEIIYYTTAANSKIKACGEHSEWANLPCETKPAVQPGTTGLPALPVVKDNAYNVWNEPETIEEAVGSTIRTKTMSYDASGRLKTSSISSTVGTALPTVTDRYEEKTGALIEQSTTAESKTKKVTSVYNTLGQLTSYTDAAENTATYEYDQDGRVIKTNDGKGTQTYAYSKVTGLLSELVDSSHEGMKFIPSYDVEGKVLAQSYPNGMVANYSYSQTGAPIALEYKKTTHCTEEKEKCIWFKDAIVPSIHGQWMEQISSLSKQVYTYDTVGRLTQVQNTPAGGTCTTRVYTYEADTNRTGLTSYEPNAKGECATEHDTEEKHTYDEADRLTDAGVKYNEFGDITALPAKDAGGKESSEELTSTYYTDDQLASQSQGGQTIGYNLDPAGRTLESVATGKKVANTTFHYAAPSASPSWTTNTTGEVTRDIPGISGSLAAIQTGTEAPVLQLSNLHGDIVATASFSETATELASKADTSEFGVPTTSLPPKYSWLGALEIPTELPSGVVGMGARSYVPQLGRFLQPDPVSGGSANAYSYTFGDPVNTFDPSGEMVSNGIPSAANIADAIQMTNEAVTQRAAEEAAARAAAEAAARAAEEAEVAAFGPQYAGGEEEWEEYEEEEEYEYASYHHESKSDSEEGHMEDVVLVQPLQEEGGAEEDEGSTSSAGSRLMILGGCPNVHDPCYPKKPTGHRHRSRAKQQNPEARACTASEECGKHHGCLPTCGNTPEQKAAREAVEFLTPVVKEVGETVVQHFTPAGG